MIINNIVCLLIEHIGSLCFACRVPEELDTHTCLECQILVYPKLLGERRVIVEEKEMLARDNGRLAEENGELHQEIARLHKEIEELRKKV